jgi:hypothetical protein
VPGKLDRIKDDALRASLEQAQTSLRSGDYADVVKRASEAYAELLRRRPGLLEGPQSLRAVLFFPRLGARLVVDNNKQPQIIYDREKFTISEAITYFEFAVDSLVREGL